MKEEEILQMEELLEKKQRETEEFISRLRRIRKLCEDKIIEKPRWFLFCPKCGRKLEIFDTGPISYRKCNCGYEYVHRVSSEEGVKYFLDRNWSLPPAVFY